MNTHRSLVLTSDAGSRFSVSPVQGLHGRFTPCLLLVIVAVTGISACPRSGVAGRFDTEPSSITNTPPAAEIDPLVVLVNEAIAKTGKRYLDVNIHTPWQIVHGLLALRRDFELRSGDGTVNAIEWLSNGAYYKGVPIFEATQYGGRAQPYNGTMYDFEGHPNQTLALMCMSNLPLNHEFTVSGGRKLTMADMIRHAQMTVNTQEETTWTLWLLTNYLDQEAQWTNQWGQKWSIEVLVHIQNQVDVTKAACGGTHNLFALAYARNAYLQKYGQARGVWLEADQKLQRHIASVRALQNVDGSFSTKFFKGAGHSTDFNERIRSSGHNLEWLMMALPQNRLDEEWLRRGVESLATDLIRNASLPADCGPLYHSLHALVLYQQRVAPDLMVSPEHPLAKRMTVDDVTPGPLSSNGADEEAAPRRTPPQSPVIIAQPRPSTLPDQGGAVPKPLSPAVDGRPVQAREAPSNSITDSSSRGEPLPDSTQHRHPEDTRSPAADRPSLEAPAETPTTQRAEKPEEPSVPTVATPNRTKESAINDFSGSPAPNDDAVSEQDETKKPVTSNTDSSATTAPAPNKTEEESPGRTPRPAAVRPPGTLTFLRPAPNHKPATLPSEQPQEKGTSSDTATPAEAKPTATESAKDTDRLVESSTQADSTNEQAIGPIHAPPKPQLQYVPQQKASPVPGLRAPADLFVPLNRKYLRAMRRASRSSFETEPQPEPTRPEDAIRRPALSAP